MQRDHRLAASELQFLHVCRSEQIERAERVGHALCVAHAMYVPHAFGQRPDQAGQDRMLLVQRVQKRRSVEFNHLQRERIQDFGQKSRQHAFRHMQQIDDHRFDAVCRFNLFRRFLRQIAIRISRIQQHNIGFAGFLYGLHALRFRFRIVFPRDIGNRAVRQNHDPDGGMVLDHLACSDLRRPLERNLLLVPRCADHARFAFFLRPDRAGHQKAHAVYEPHAGGHRFVQTDLDRFIRNKLRLCRHDRFARSALRQFVDQAISCRFVFNIRYHQKLGKTFDESGFSGSHGTDHAEIDIPLRPFQHISV